MLTIYEIAGLSITVLLAVLAYLRSDGDVRQQNTTLVSLIGTIFTMLMSLRFGVLPDLERHMAFAKEIQDTPRARQLATEIATAIGIANATRVPLMRDVLQARLDTLHGELSQVSKGAFLVPIEEIPDFAIRLINGSKATVVATSYVRAAEWWNTAWGRRYEDLNYQAHRRGVRITRIFIFSSQEELAAARTHLDRQRTNGVEVLTIMKTDMAAPVTSDMIIIDDQLAGELVLTPDKGIQRAVFMTEQGDISSIRTRLNVLLAAAEPLQTAVLPQLTSNRLE